MSQILIKDIRCVLIFFQVLSMEKEKLLDISKNIHKIQPENIPAIAHNLRQTYPNLKEDLNTLGTSLFNLASNIMKITDIKPDSLPHYEQIIDDIIICSINNYFLVGFDALRSIFNTNAEFYKKANVDLAMKFPLGIHRPLINYEPKVGEECDVVKPYITSTSYCGWVRCKVQEIQGDKYTLNYANSATISTPKQKPFFAPLGTRTIDFEWRMSLDVGSHIEALSDRVWYESTVMDTSTQNGHKTVKVSYRRFSKDGDYQDSQGNWYYGLAPTQDEWIDVLSPRIQQEGKMVFKKLCYYTPNSQQILLDDNYDIIFEKQYNQEPFHAIMRSIFVRSLSYVRFINTFTVNKGFERYFEALNIPDINLDAVFMMQTNIGCMVPLIPRMDINRYLPQVYEKTFAFFKESTKKLNSFRLDQGHFCLDIVGRRLFSLTEVHRDQNQLRKHFITTFLKMNMEKQMFAVRFVNDLIYPKKPYTQQQRQQLNEFIIRQDIFHQIFQNQTHEQILTRTQGFLKYMIEKGIVRQKEIDYLWSMIPQSDQRGRAVIEKLLAQLSKGFPMEFVENLLEKILKLKETELTLDNLNLLRELKNRSISSEYQQKILTFLWDTITIKSYNIKSNVEDEVQKVFKGFISGIKSSAIRVTVLKQMMARLTETKKVHRQIDLLRHLIESYPSSSQLKSNPSIEPITIADAIKFMKQRDIYEKILTLINNSKKDEVVVQLLKFVGFLFEYDDCDNSDIIRPIYEKLGPSNTFLEWLNKNVEKGQNFIQQMLGSDEKLDQFAELSKDGFENLQEIIISINEKMKKLKVMTTYKSTINQQDKNTNKSTQSHVVFAGVTESKPENKKMIGPVLPGKVKHLYILVSPFQLIGMKFLNNLLHILKNGSVYDMAIKSIIKFIVKLDESISDRTIEYRKQFLNETIKEIEKIYKQNQMNEAITKKIQVYIHLFLQFFSETQKNGLGNLRPHFETIKGLKFTIHFENIYQQNKDIKIGKFDLIVNENDTAWTLKTKLAEIIKENPLTIDVIKYVTPVDDGNHGKSLVQLFFFDQENSKVAKKPVKDMPRHNLLNQQSNDLSERFHEIVKQWFDDFKNKENQLTKEGLKALSNDRWKGSLSKKDSKIQKIIQDYDKNSKGYLQYQQFKQFFYEKSNKSNNIVWRLLILSGYKYNLKKTIDQVKEVNSDSLPRRLLSCQPVYDLIFNFLTNNVFESVQLNFYRLLSNLEVDSQIQQQIQGSIYSTIESSESLYQFCYAIEVVNSSITNNPDFMYEFWRKQGCHRLIERIKKIVSSQQSIYKLDAHTKNTLLPNMFKIINIYISYLLSTTKVNRFLSTVKINTADMDELQKKLEKYTESEQQDAEMQAVKFKLEEISPEIDYKAYYSVAYEVLQGLIDKFQKNVDFLPKLTSEAVRLIGFLAIEKAQLFNPYSLIGGTTSQSLNYRRSSANLIYLYVEHASKPSIDSQKLLLKLLDEMPIEPKFIYQNYFSLLSKILEFQIKKNVDSKEKDQFLVNLANNLLNKFLQHTEGELRTALVADKLMVGILEIIVILLNNSAVCEALKNRKHEITEKCLFSYNIKQRLAQLQITEELLCQSKQPQHFKDYVLCKTEETRNLAYKIVNKLHSITATQDQDFIEKYIFPILEDLGESVRMTDKKNLNVGLKNFGSTCYMNSMLQVLNSIGPFRNLLLKTEAHTQLVSELKKTFSALFFSQRVDYSPDKLLQAFVPPINPGIQQDTTEFLNFLFDQLETGLSKTEIRNLLDQLFKGKLKTQMICLQCGFKKQNNEDFFSYGIEIDGKYNLPEALEHAHEGETISDYFCDECQQKGDMKKRSLLHDIPNIFFIHLRRIVFNYDMFVNMKIHTRLEFPKQLNIEPYTKEGVQLREQLGLQYMKSLTHNEEEMKKFEEKALHGKDKDHYMLKLKGVIIHTGSADAGHYYSIISNEKNWQKFDDSRISIFSQSGFESQCFGGQWQNQQWGGFGSSTNAYFLVYQRVIKNDIRISLASQSQQILNYNDIKIYNTANQYRQAWLQNHKFMVQNHLIQQNYAKGFMEFIVNLLKESTNINKIELISKILYSLTIHSECIGDLEEIFNKCLSEITPDILHNYILRDKKKTFKLLFSHDKQVRKFMSSYISVVLIQVYQRTDQQADRKQVKEFVREYINNMPGQIAKNWLRIDGFFAMLYKFVQASSSISELWQFILGFNLISTLIDFYLQKSSPVKLMPKSYSLGTKTNPVNFEAGLETIALLLKYSYGLNGQSDPTKIGISSKIFHLNDNDVICLSYAELYKKITRQRQNSKALSAIIKQLCHKNLPFSTMISEVLITTIGSSTDQSDDMEDMSQIILSILKIDDGYWRHRAEMILGVSSPYILDRNVMCSTDEERYVFTSTLYDIFPVESLFAYIYLYRLKNSLACFYLGKAILEGCMTSDQSKQFLIKQPSHSYYFHDYLEWLQSFMKNFIGFLTISEKVREKVQKDIDVALKYFDCYKNYIQANKVHMNLYKTVITGEMFDINELSKIEKQGIEVILYEYETYCMDSDPQHSSNKALDDYMEGGRLQKPIHEESTLLRFMKNPKKPIGQKKKSAEETQDAQLVDLFNQLTQLDPPTEPLAKQKQKEQKEQEVQSGPIETPKLINLTKQYRTNKYYKQLKITNNTKSTKIVKLFFKDKQKNSNVIVPLTFTFKISAKSNQCLWFSKQNYEKQWTPIQYDVEVEEYCKQKHENSTKKMNWFKVYGEQMEKEMVKQEEMSNNEKVDQGTETSNKNNQQSQIKQVSCPVCTFINLSIVGYCEVCGQKLF